MIKLQIPSPGESITEVEIASWLVEDGDVVAKDQEVAEIESDKATLPLIAEQGGKIKILAEEGATVKVGDVACEIDTSVAPEAPVASAKDAKEAPVVKEEAPVKTSEPKKELAKDVKSADSKVKVTPVAEKLMQEHDLSVDDIINGLKRIGKKEVQSILGGGVSTKPVTEERVDDVNKMSSLRRKISERLVSVKNDTAMLTTFNEVNMQPVMELRKKYQKFFVEKHEVKLGFMSFFTKAVVEALKVFPNINSQIVGEDIVTPNYYDVAIAVQTDKGLMVPVLRDVQNMSLADIEKQIIEKAKKARSFKLSIEEMTGGSFTITNGGIYGSLLSTPILNPPQSGILGMHNIVERPVAENGQVVIRPMMYIALSYDHRIVDGKDSVSFLVKIKQLLENPAEMLGDGKSLDQLLLDL